MIKNDIITKLTFTMLALFTAFLLWNYSANITSVAVSAARNFIQFVSPEPERIELVHYNIVEKNVKKVDAHSLKCLADNIYYEASSQSAIGKIAIGRVVMNRLSDKRFPSSVCGVIYQKANETCQFSWTCQEQESRTPINSSIYKESKEIAYKLLAFDMFADSFKHIKFYHNATVDPGWAKKSKVVLKLEDHTFYSEIK